LREKNLQDIDKLAVKVPPKIILTTVSKQFQLQNKTLLTSFCAKVFIAGGPKLLKNFKIGDIREEEESSRPLISTKLETRATHQIWWYLRKLIIG
jgi:hypothetical protein